MPQRILVIANDAALLRATSEQLTARGHLVDTTPDGTDGFQRSLHSPPALVVLQVELENGQNGYLLCGKLKKDEALAHVPVVIVGNPEGFKQHQKLKARADAYVALPVNVAEVVEVVERLLREGPATPRSAAPAVPVAPAAPVASAERQGLWGWLRGLFQR
jgi:DNA-binding response OmpR family regulator